MQVLENLGVEVIFPEDQTCCGQPAFNAGDWASSRKVVRHAMDVFAGDLPIIVPSGSCAAMNFHGSPLQFEDEADLDRVKDFGRRSWEIIDFIVHGLGVRTWPGSYRAKLAFHHSCHTRGTGTRAAVRTLLGSIDGLELQEFGEGEQCCGFGGTFCVKYPDISNAIVEEKTRRIAESGAATLLAGDLGCLMNMAGKLQRDGSAVRVRHVAEVLADMGDSAPIGEAGWNPR